MMRAKTVRMKGMAIQRERRDRRIMLICLHAYMLICWSVDNLLGGDEVSDIQYSHWHGTLP